ncbi:hypothetical protein GF325_09010 [Candidatus Bathyarchaeota archaeon]|nr:hypothetical protein [Candidatus Bathyarchaeota archaeon]
MVKGMEKIFCFLRARGIYFIALILALSILALATPVASYDDGSDVTVFWYWALNVNRNSGDIWFNTSKLAVLGAILETAIIGVTVSLLFKVLAWLVKGETTGKQKQIRIFLLLSGIFLILAAMGYMIGTEAYIENAWQRYNVGFGLVASFIGSGISFILLVPHWKERDT